MIAIAFSVAPCVDNASARTGHSADDVDPSSLGGKALSVADWVFDNTSENHYAHVHGKADKQVIIHEGKVISNTDCSGFINNILKTAAPKHYEMVVKFNQGKRPIAATYNDFFAGLDAARSKHGWQGINSVFDLLPGDLIAWKSPKYEEYHKGNSGHVMILALLPPTKVEGRLVAGKLTRFIELTVVDSSSVTHFPPEQLPQMAKQRKRDGVGKGVIRIILDKNDQPIGYWEGTFWNEGGKEIRKPTATTDVHFARLQRFPHGD
jgi:hypothetical protein